MLLKKMGQDVLVGDRVRVGSIDWVHGRAQVEEVFPRTSQLEDPTIANVNFALLVFALHNPMFEETQVSRFLVAQEASGLPFRLLLNKVDLVPEAEVQARVQQVRSWGYDPLVVSCQSGRGVPEVLQALQGTTAVVAGPSGAGKSSLINALRLGRHRPDQGAGSLVATSGSFRNEDQTKFLVVGEMSRYGKGKHTTTSVSLIRLPGGGWLADTPGFSQPSLDRVSSQELASLFPEFVAIAEAAGGCRFANCHHVAEPGCPVTAQPQPLERYPYYLKFLDEIREREERDVKFMQAGKKARQGSSKVKADKGGKQRIEAKLELHSHRKVSRTQMKQSFKSDWNKLS
ncbi:hypothetical protein V8C86DRAFT_3012707 [Haematococcus lacustris]